MYIDVYKRQALDGTLDIKSTLGRGTVVTLGLPLYHKA